MSERPAPVLETKAARPAAAVFIVATVFIDAMAFALIMPVLPSLLQELAGTGIAGRRSGAGWRRSPSLSCSSFARR